MIGASRRTLLRLLANATFVCGIALGGACGDEDSVPGIPPPVFDADVTDACTTGTCAADASRNDACVGLACNDATTPDACMGAACGDANGVDSRVPGALDLTLSPGVLSPAFDAAIPFYTARIALFVEQVTVTVHAAEDVQLSINGAAIVSDQPWQSPPLNVGENLLRVQVTETGRPAVTYTLAISRGYQEAYAKPDSTRVVTEGTGLGDEFGTRVAIFGDTLVVGAPQNASGATGINGDSTDVSALGSGAAYVFVRNGNTWTQQAFLKASNAEEGDSFGCSVAIASDTIVVGALNEASNATGIGGNQANNEGSYSGAVYVFERSGTTWSQQAYLKAGNADVGDFFGSSVALSDSTLVVGAPLESSSATSVNGPNNNDAVHSGAAYVFVRGDNGWSQQAYLKASNAEAQDRFGEQVAIDGSRIVVGAHQESSQANGSTSSPTDNSATRSGAAYVFVRNGTTWSQEAFLKANSGDAEDRFGSAVAISNDTLVIGAINEASRANGVNGDASNNEAEFAGAAYIFQRSGPQWSQTAYLKASNTGAFDFFGTHVAVHNDRVLVAATWEASSSPGFNGSERDNRAANAGAIYLFTRSASTWQQLAYVKASNAGADHFFGSPAIDNDTFVIGAPGETSAATGINGDQSDQSAYRAGAVYVFR